MQNSVFGFTGARSLTPQSLSVVSALAASVARAGGTVYTCCAQGADKTAIAGSLAAHRLPVVFAVGSEDGQGFPGQGGVPGHILDLPDVTFLAGGPLSLPLVARLARRSLDMVRAVAAAGGSLVAFPAAGTPPRAFGPGPFPSCGSGTWSTVGAAVLLGVPVFVVLPHDLNASPPGGLPAWGYWEESSQFGVTGWSYVPAQATF